MNKSCCRVGLNIVTTRLKSLGKFRTPIKGGSVVKNQSTLQRTLQALFITGISIIALEPALAADSVEVTANAAEKPRLVLQITVDHVGLFERNSI
jgi:hypothetical protein